MLLLGVLEVLLDRRVLDRLTIVGLFWLAVAAAAAAFAVHVPLPRASRPQRPVLFLNPRSGGGKAERFKLADEARKRGIEPIELGPGDDLARLVKTAVDEGADALAMAGGDGSQAVVAAAAPSSISRTPVFRRAPATTSLWTWASIETTWSERSTRSSTGASVSWISPR